MPDHECRGRDDYLRSKKQVRFQTMLGTLKTFFVESRSTGAKIVSTLLSILAWILFSNSPQVITGTWIFIPVIATEHLIFINSFATSGFLTLALAKQLISDQHVGILLLGYPFCMIAHVTSFYLGRLVRTRQQAPALLGLFLTLWHPLLASQQAFAFGASSMRVSKYLSYALPIAALYYALVCLLLWLVPFSIKVTDALSWSVILMSLWVLYDIVLYVRRKHV